MTNCCHACHRPFPPEQMRFPGPWLPRQYEVIMLVGMTGSGKSHLFKTWLEVLQEAGRACFVIDVGDEYSRQGNSRGGTLQLGPLRKRMTVPEFLSAFRSSSAFIRAPGASIAIVPTVTDAGEALAEQIKPVLRILYARGNCVVGFDELQKYGAWLQAELYRAAGELGKDGVVPFFVSQYPGGIPEIVRKQVSTAVCGEVGKASDRRMLAMDFDQNYVDALRGVSARTFLCGFSRSAFANPTPVKRKKATHG